MNEMRPNKSLKCIPLLPCRAMLREPVIWQKNGQVQNQKSQEIFSWQIGIGARKLDLFLSLC